MKFVAHSTETAFLGCKKQIPGNLICATISLSWQYSREINTQISISLLTFSRQQLQLYVIKYGMQIALQLGQSGIQ